MKWSTLLSCMLDNTNPRLSTSVQRYVMPSITIGPQTSRWLKRHKKIKRNTYPGVIVAFLMAMVAPCWADTIHTPFSELLASYVKPTSDGLSTQVDYRGLAGEKVKLDRYLSTLAAINKDEFDNWSQPKQLAFLINAYNGYTLALILEHYGEIASIRDIGGFFSSPWKQKIAPLLGETRTLDGIEHGLIRKENRYNEPRIHFAVNCASVGCPALRGEAYTGEALETQLDEQTRLFLSDKSRNYVTGNELYLSKIFDWYREDFEKGFRDTKSVQAFVALYSAALSLTPSQVKALSNNAFEVNYTEYNWALNDTE
jgi:hypothetical protein